MHKTSRLALVISTLLLAVLISGEGNAQGDLRPMMVEFEYSTLVSDIADYNFHSLAISGDAVLYPVDSSYLKLFAHDVGRGETREILSDAYIPIYGNVAYQHYSVTAVRGAHGTAAEPSGVIRYDYYNDRTEPLIPSQDYDRYQDLSLSYPYLVFVRESFPAHPVSSSAWLCDI